MMETIFTRRSIRKFTGEIVSDELIDKLLHAAMAAPSAGNAQPWHFVIIRDRKIMEEVINFHPPHARMMLQAGTAILVCADPALEKYPGRWMLDCSAATQNILLAATDLGLGAVWCGIYPEPARMDAYYQLLNVPREIYPVSLVPVGIPADNPAPVDRYQPERIHRDKW
jgi:nitroreductase